ncbi:MAG: hypothetical protein IJO13_06990 [Lachnospiraceae bacterium]|nr:hypothetical protein [Lachnospiraceae bacterium]
MLTTGTIFQATDKLKRKNVYEFNGVNLNDSTGCSYINLHNLTLDIWIGVEYSWFKAREITVISNGMIVGNGSKRAKIVNVKAGISNNNLEVLTLGKKFLHEGTDIWCWDSTELSQLS